jgi:hypothetical protein
LYCGAYFSCSGGGLTRRDFDVVELGTPIFTCAECWKIARECHVTVQLWDYEFQDFGYNGWARPGCSQTTEYDDRFFGERDHEQPFGLRCGFKVTRGDVFSSDGDHDKGSAAAFSIFSVR